MDDHKKTIVITGASQGIGEGLVNAFLQRGSTSSRRLVMSARVSLRVVRIASRWSTETSWTRRLPNASQRWRSSVSDRSTSWSTRRAFSSARPQAPSRQLQNLAPTSDVLTESRILAAEFNGPALPLALSRQRENRERRGSAARNSERTM
jgi:hypothetical protein